MFPPIKGVAYLAIASASIFLGYLAWRPPPTLALTVDAQSHDFGAVPSALTTLTHTFTFRNSGSVPISFDGIIKTCGCTSVSLSRPSLSPGESALAACVVDPRGRRGTFEVAMKFLYHQQSTNPERKEVLICALKASIENIVRVSPAALEFDASRPSTQVIRLTAPTPGIKAVAAESEDRAVLAKVDPTGTAVEVTFNPILWRHLDSITRVIVTTTHDVERHIPIMIVIHESASH